jgi:hypothetical protein
MGAADGQASAEEWAVVELFGHVRLAGRVSEVERFGGKMLRLEIPKPDGGWLATKDIGSAALYAVTYTDEATARVVAAHHQPAPVHRYELEAPKPEPADDSNADPDEWPAELVR